MSNVQALVCHPRSLFHRSDSKSSLNIGVRPIRPMYAGVVRMEMHNINGNHSPNLAARRSRPQHLVNGTGNKTASKGTYLGILYNLIVLHTNPKNVKSLCATLITSVISRKFGVAHTRLTLTKRFTNLTLNCASRTLVAPKMKSDFHTDL